MAGWIDWRQGLNHMPEMPGVQDKPPLTVSELHVSKRHVSSVASCLVTYRSFLSAQVPGLCCCVCSCGRVVVEDAHSLLASTAWDHPIMAEAADRSPVGESNGLEDPSDLVEESIGLEGPSALVVVCILNYTPAHRTAGELPRKESSTSATGGVPHDLALYTPVGQTHVEMGGIAPCDGAMSVTAVCCTRQLAKGTVLGQSFLSVRLVCRELVQACGGQDH